MENLLFLIGGVMTLVKDVTVSDELLAVMRDHIPQAATGWRNWRGYVRLSNRGEEDRKRKRDECDDEEFPVPHPKKKGYSPNERPLNELPVNKVAEFLAYYQTDLMECTTPVVINQVTFSDDMVVTNLYLDEEMKEDPYEATITQLRIFLNRDVQRETVVIGDVDDEFDSE